MIKLRSEERCGAAVKRQNKAGMYMRMASESRMYGKNCGSHRKEDKCISSFILANITL